MVSVSSVTWPWRAREAVRLLCRADRQGLGLGQAPEVLRPLPHPGMRSPPAPGQGVPGLQAEGAVKFYAEALGVLVMVLLVVILLFVALTVSPGPS
jgi:hypothetical protein